MGTQLPLFDNLHQEGKVNMLSFFQTLSMETLLLVNFNIFTDSIHFDLANKMKKKYVISLKESSDPIL